MFQKCNSSKIFLSTSIWYSSYKEFYSECFGNPAQENYSANVPFESISGSWNKFSFCLDLRSVWLSLNVIISVWWRDECGPWAAKKEEAQPHLTVTDFFPVSIRPLANFTLQKQIIFQPRDRIKPLDDWRWETLTISKHLYPSG